MRRVARVILATSLLGGASCTPTTDLSGSGRVRGYERVGTTQGSAVAVTQDERIAVVANRTDGVVSILPLQPKWELNDLVRSDERIELAFPPLKESKPWAVVIGADDDTAFVLLRGSRQVARITGIHGVAPEVAETIDVGSEPTSLVISPSGRKLYVANSGDGTISAILWEEKVTGVWDLNRRLGVSGRLGDLEGVWTEPELAKIRPALAHPRALAMTDNGDDDDDDEMLFATEFFAQPLSAPADDPQQLLPDQNREGIVYPIEVGRGGGTAPLNGEDVAVETIALAPVPTGFTDSEGNPTFCYPNQLAAATAVQDRVFVTALCASPDGPVEAGLGDASSNPNFNNNFKTLVHPAVFAVDTAVLEAVPAEALVLTSALERAYPADLVGHGRRMPLLPSALLAARDAQESTAQLYLTASGAAAVFPLTRTAGGWSDLAALPRQFIDVGLESLPVGMALLSDQRALVFDDHRPGLIAVDLSDEVRTSPRDTRTASGDSDEAVSEQVREGRRLFATGLDAWSLNGQSWSSCESCHPEGLSDGVTWRVARGPRRAISLAGTYYRDSDQRRLMLWTGNLDELHDFEGIARGLSGGVGGVVWKPYLEEPHKNCRLLYDGSEASPSGTSADCASPKTTQLRRNGLNGALAVTTFVPGEPTCDEALSGPCDVNASKDWDSIDQYIRTVLAPRSSSRFSADLVSRGEQLFKEHRCSGCHGGEGWSISKVFYEPGLAANGAVPYAPPDMNPYVDGSLGPLEPILGGLRATSYGLPVGAPSAFGLLNPPLGDKLSATYRSSPPETADSEAKKVAFLFSPSPDQINCALRDVGTFPVLEARERRAGVVAEDSPPIWEGRRIKQLNPETMMMEYRDELGTGMDGFNVPSLVGLAAGAPYFHAGNARTLEEVFDPRFSKHYKALSDAFEPTADDIRALVSYLLSIDESDEAKVIPVPIAELGFDPDLCAQFRP